MFESYAEETDRCGLTPEEVYDDGATCGHCAFCLPLFLADGYAGYCCVLEADKVHEVDQDDGACRHFEKGDDEQ